MDLKRLRIWALFTNYKKVFELVLTGDWTLFTNYKKICELVLIGDNTKNTQNTV